MELLPGNMWEDYKDKTRILILGKGAGTLYTYILNFLGREMDLITPESAPTSSNDFALLISDDPESASGYSPNIVLQTLPQPVNTVLDHLVAGGIYIFPEAVETPDKTEAPAVYCRQIPYPASSYTLAQGSAVVTTDLGPLPVAVSDPSVLDHLEGVRILCQHTGIMEEAFYEALMNYRS
ncbi:hypothetical protein [Chryseobacterium sp.]|uniref:hypothetical protein n=1 Tax=Chryseobacterium sp. TaxID=1871047 RepID=UPI0012A80274|nr:hypothetical protein [Chryseobacterium sp.]QFG53706.1 hypothetical protein F7R58_09120 [Chryseobacterium sp.]